MKEETYHPPPLHKNGDENDSGEVLIDLEEGRTARATQSEEKELAHTNGLFRSGAITSPRYWLKSERQMRWHMRLELELLRREWPWIAGCILVEYIHMLAHNFIYYLEGIYWKKEGPPAALDDLGLKLLANRLPATLEWLVGLFTCILVGLALTLGLGRLTLNHIAWGGPYVKLVTNDDDLEGNSRDDVENNAMTIHGEEDDGDVDVTVAPLIAVPLVWIFKRASQALIVALLLRVTTFTVTMLPNPAEYCHGSFWDPPRTFGQVFTRIAVTGSCGDLLFSGHTAHGMVLLLVVVRYARSLKVAVGLAVSSMVLLAFSLLAFSAHYTSDVWVAVYVTLMIWKILPDEPKVLSFRSLRIDAPVLLQISSPVTSLSDEGGRCSSSRRRVDSTESCSSTGREEEEGRVGRKAKE